MKTTNEQSLVDNFDPLPGHILVQVESRYQAMEGGIVIPEETTRLRSIIGTVWKVNDRPVDLRHLGCSLEVGDRVVVAHHLARHVVDDYWLYPLTWEAINPKRVETGIIAIARFDVDLSSVAEEMPRCQWCGSAREDTMQSLLLVDDVCPRCRKDAKGDYHDPAEASALNEEEENRIYRDMHNYRQSFRAYSEFERKRAEPAAAPK